MQIENFLTSSGIEFKKKIEGKSITYLRTGGIINLYITPKSEFEFINLIHFLKDNKLKFIIVGLTCNSMLRDEKVYDIVICTRKLSGYKFSSDNTIEVECGLTMPKLALIMLHNSITGFELLEGIPGSIGGGIFMNASTFDCQISDQLLSVKFLDNNANVITLQKKDLNFSFRSSIFHNLEGYILSAKFDVWRKGNTEEIRNKMRKYKNIRLKMLEYDKPNLGSNFCTYDIYNEIGKHNPGYKIVITILKKLRLDVVLGNKFLNFITSLYFGWKKYPYSKKTLNSFYKTEKVGSKDFIELIDAIKSVTKNKLRLEIRIF